MPGISIDSRTIKRGDLFIPIKGQNYDGHDFIPEAIRKGAKVLNVKDGLKALQNLAAKHRKKFNLPVIGITGSVGKTTTKDMLASILSQKYSTLKNEENKNNEIGVPLTLLKLNKKHKAAVIEMAVQKPGDMDDLVEIVQPNFAIVTNIGDSHLEYFKHRKNVAREKNKIFRYAKPLTPAKKEELKGIRLPVPGKHNQENALAAITVAKALKIPKTIIKKGLENFKPSGKRMEIIKKNGITIINDTYNANPQSMAAALETLADYKPKTKDHRLFAVLGNMFELGKIEKSAHKKILKLARKLKIDKVLTLGNLWPDPIENKKSLLKILKKLIKPHDIILIKGSRGMKMEEISAAVVELADTYA